MSFLGLKRKENYYIKLLLQATLRARFTYENLQFQLSKKYRKKGSRF